MVQPRPSVSGDVQHTKKLSFVVEGGSRMRKRFGSVHSMGGGMHLDQMLRHSEKILMRGYTAHLKMLGIKGLSSDVVGFDGQQRVYFPNCIQTWILLSSGFQPAGFGDFLNGGV